VDALSDVLKAVRLTGATFFDIRASDPWVAETPAGNSIVRKIFPDAEHLIPHHVVTRGTCWGAVAEGEPVRLSAGDVIVFPHGDAHTISSAPGMRGAPNLAVYRWPSDGQLPVSMTMGDSGADSSHIVCGYLGCDARPFNPLLAALRASSTWAIEKEGRSARSYGSPSPKQRSGDREPRSCSAT
jgi:hypothetical protein